MGMLNMVSATAPEMMEYFQPSCTENTRKPNMPTTMEGSEDSVSMAVEAMSRMGPSSTMPAIFFVYLRYAIMISPIRARVSSSSLDTTSTSPS